MGDPAEVRRSSADEGVGTDVHSIAVASIRPGARVADLGCGAGRVAEMLAHHNCRVVGLDIDRDALGQAERWCERVVAADIESVSERSLIEQETFDAVLLLDVLEHLHQPVEVLRWAAKLLEPGGFLVVSIPNVTHAAVRLKLLDGEFTYTDSGLLDHTHLHLYDRRAAEQLVDDAGLVVIDRLRVRRGVDETEIEVDVSSLPASRLAEVTKDDDAFTYQFVYLLAPSLQTEAVLPLAGHLQARLERTADVLSEATTYARHLEQELAARVAELDDRFAEIRALQADLTLKESYILRLRTQLADKDGELTAALGYAAEVERLRQLVAEERDRVERHREMVDDLESLLQRTRDRAGYRLIERVHGSLGVVPGLRSAGRWLARRLAGS